MPPIVGISQCLDDRGRWRQGRDYVYLDVAYGRAIEAAGGTPIHLPLQADATSIVDRIDALVLPGGDDFVPDDAVAYPHSVFTPTPSAQLEFDVRLLAASRARQIPVLGICYGMQLLSVQHGGSLHYHLPIDLPDAASHRLPEATGRHPLRVEPGSRLASILGESPPAVNSLHHQAVRTPGEGLVVSARGPDGVIEAIEADGDDFLLGVQWHPEKLDGDARTALFRALVRAC